MAEDFSEEELKSEIWKPVSGYEFYEVSNLGRVKSLPRNNTRGGILKTYIHKVNGYVYAGLCKNNKSKTMRVHRMVMEAFNPCVQKKSGYDVNWTIDHIDGDKTNNRLSNLDWCSQSENQLRAYRIGINGKSCRKCIDLDTKEVFESLTDAAISVGGRKPSAINKVCNGLRSQYRNHRFAYLDDYENNTIPEYKGRIRRESSKGLWR